MQQAAAVKLKQILPNVIRAISHICSCRVTYSASPFACTSDRCDRRSIYIFFVSIGEMGNSALRSRANNQRSRAIQAKGFLHLQGTCISTSDVRFHASDPTISPSHLQRAGKRPKILFWSQLDVHLGKHHGRPRIVCRPLSI